MGLCFFMQRKRVKKEEMEVYNDQNGVKDENNGGGGGGGKKREKKSFTLPGQKRDPPDQVLTYVSHPAFIFICIN